MTPAEIRDATISQLRAARDEMVSGTWMLAIEGKDSKTQEDAARQLLRVHHAIQKLDNEELARLKDALVANEKDLANGRLRLAKALKNLNRVSNVLNTVGRLLDVVAKVTAVIL